MTSACAALDAITASVYQSHNLGNVGNDSFQQRIVRSLDAVGAYHAYENDLVTLSLNAAKAAQVTQSLRGSINQAANVMQTMRAGLGDVHGTKPTLEHLVFQIQRQAVLIATIFRGAGVN